MNLAESLGEGPVPAEALSIRVAYELDGRPVEEEFYALQNGVRVPYHGPVGITGPTARVTIATRTMPVSIGTSARA